MVEKNGARCRDGVKYSGVMQSFSFENLLLPVQLKDVMEQCLISIWDRHIKHPVPLKNIEEQI